MTPLPDFGTLANQALGTTPFNLRVFTSRHITCAFQPHGTTIVVPVESYRSDPVILVTAVSLLVIEIPSASKHQAQRAIDQLLGEGLMLQTKPDRQYRTRDGIDVIPISVVRELTEIDRGRIARASDKRQKRNLKKVRSAS